MDRRRFAGTLAGCALGGRMLARFLGGSLSAQDAVDFALPQGEAGIGLAPALHYEKLPGLKVVCKLCPHECRVADAERGTCGVRENRGGEYFTLVYGRTCSIHVDPIEKKPLFHVLPGSQALSLATAGCNMECRFCQNWEISQFRPEQVSATYLPPGAVHELAKRHGAPSIAYTYSEPTIYHEYMLDTAKLGAETGVRSVVVSAGFTEEQPLRDLLPFVDAVKIDLKSFRQEFYDQICRGELKVVQRTIEIIRKAGKWLELVVLVVPTRNDSVAEVRAMARWVKETLGPDVPLHFSRFHPTYRLRDLPPTPVAIMQRAYETARAEGLRYVYIGNMPGHPAESTFCWRCAERVVERAGNSLVANHLRAGHCPKCNERIPGVWS